MNRKHLEWNIQQGYDVFSHNISLSHVSELLSQHIYMLVAAQECGINKYKRYTV